VLLCTLYCQLEQVLAVQRQ